MPVAGTLSGITMNEGEIPVAGGTLCYRRVGKGHPSVVLIHGFSDDGTCWPRLVADLAADYDLILPDMRGHGRSVRVAPDTAADLAGDVLTLIVALALERPVLLGHSMGASIAAEVAARSPQSVRALILEDPPWRDGENLAAQEEAARVHYQQWIAFAQSQSVEALVEQVRAQHPTWDESEFLPWAESKHRLDPHFLDMPMPWWRPWRETAAAITCPLLLITGEVEAGAIVTPDVAREVLHLLPQAEVAALRGAGHSVRREAYADYLNVVRDFLQRV